MGSNPAAIRQKEKGKREKEKKQILIIDSYPSMQFTQ